MAFIRLKRIKGVIYVYLVKNNWDKQKKSSRQKVIGYLGKVKGLETFQAKEIFERDRYSCQVCGFVQDLTIDHKIPLSKGGSNDTNNLWTLCRKCNGKKKDSNKFIIEKQNMLNQFKDFYW